MKAALFSLLLLLSAQSFAINPFGLFGPDNFDECVLEKLKGQASSPQVTRIARQACDRLFPQERVLSERLESWSWSLSDYGILTVNATPPSQFIITTVEVHLEKKQCGHKYENLIDALKDQDTVKVAFEEGSSVATKKIQKDPSQYKCAKVGTVTVKRKYD